MINKNNKSKIESIKKNCLKKYIKDSLEQMNQIVVKYHQGKVLVIQNKINLYDIIVIEFNIFLINYIHNRVFKSINRVNSHL